MAQNGRITYLERVRIAAARSTTTGQVQSLAVPVDFGTVNRVRELLGPANGASGPGLPSDAILSLALAKLWYDLECSIDATFRSKPLPERQQYRKVETATDTGFGEQPAPASAPTPAPTAPANGADYDAPDGF